MAKALNLNLDGIPYAVAPTKLERKKIYGWTELRVTGGDGSICTQVNIDSTGQTIIPKGAVKNGTLREDGSWLERSGLVAVHQDGSPAEAVPSSFDIVTVLDRKVRIEEFLDNIITSVYQLDGDSAASLAAAVGDDIYAFPFSYRGGYDPSNGFLVSNGEAAFIFVGTPAHFDCVGLQEPGILDEPDDEAEIEEDELDFNMM